MKRLAALWLLLLLLLNGCMEPASSPELLPPASSAPAATAQLSPAPQAELDTSVLSSTSTFQIIYINVGQADAALVICDGETMLIDGGNTADSDLIYTFLKNKGVEHLDYIVCTHAHEDHVGGLAGALHAATAGIIYSPVNSYDSKAFSNFVKAANEQELALTIPAAGESFPLGCAQVFIRGPVKGYAEPNNTSIVVKVVYGGISSLFTGDMEREAELDLIESGADLSADVLKVGHHGGSTSTSYYFLREVMPSYAVISCGKDNSYGHPTEEVLSRLRDADVTLYRTDFQGTIVCVRMARLLQFKRNGTAPSRPIQPSQTPMMKRTNTLEM